MLVDSPEGDTITAGGVSHRFGCSLLCQPGGRHTLCTRRIVSPAGLDGRVVLYRWLTPPAVHVSPSGLGASLLISLPQIPLVKFKFMIFQHREKLGFEVSLGVVE